MLDAVGAGLAPRIGDRDWKDIWLDSPEYKQMREELEQLKADGLTHSTAHNHDDSVCEWFLLTARFRC